jgi:hypothetical protein
MQKKKPEFPKIKIDLCTPCLPFCDVALPVSLDMVFTYRVGECVPVRSAAGFWFLSEKSGFLESSFLSKRQAA